MGHKYKQTKPDVGAVSTAQKVGIQKSLKDTVAHPKKRISVEVDSYYPDSFKLMLIL